MGLLSPSVSITQYRVEGQLPSPVNDHVTAALQNNTISEIDNDASDQTIGWTSFDDPYQPDFEGSRFVIDTAWVFSLRIDKKSIPAKVLKKHYNMETAKRLAESGRDFLSKAEKKQIKDHVLDSAQHAHTGHAQCLRYSLEIRRGDAVVFYQFESGQ